MLKFFSKRRGQKGFTLIELLVVIAIIGILATIVLVSLNSARAKARDTRRASDLHQLALALEMYYDAIGGYPVLAACGAIPAALAPTYISNVPADPGTTTYQYGGSAIDYVLKATMEDSLPDNSYKLTDASTFGCTCAGALEYCIKP
ncbi:MAG: prepilin-type N-terminal cleavage/methylation domain-containing protein [Patescibacteria group bacterium]